MSERETGEGLAVTPAGLPGSSETRPLAHERADTPEGAPATSEVLAEAAQGCDAGAAAIAPSHLGPACVGSTAGGAVSVLSSGCDEAKAELVDWDSSDDEAEDAAVKIQEGHPEFSELQAAQKEMTGAAEIAAVMLQERQPELPVLQAARKGKATITPPDLHDAGGFARPATSERRIDDGAVAGASATGGSKGGNTNGGDPALQRPGGLLAPLPRLLMATYRAERPLLRL